MNNNERKTILTSLKTTLSMCDVSRDTILEANKMLNSLFSEQPTYNDREKEINYLIHKKDELIRKTRKEIKQLKLEKENILGYRRLNK